ncbi:MAG: hypothetical protein SRB2_02218 [Desulfobacteraceae bacterium Eth-SRB2]|nr:MAG: hypothetical protein SRB2_02218 [Desulfobacteraceae bacterium Eth-SRB2]
MIDYDLTGKFSDFIADMNDFYSEFNKENPAKIVEYEDRVNMSIAFFLSRLSDSLKNIENAICKGEDE